MSSKAPAFLKNDALKLQAFIQKHVRYGDKDQILYRIEHGRIRPSKNLADELASVLARPYDDQPRLAHYAEPPRPEEVVRETFCGT